MEKRKLGNSDLEITRVGFGAWAIGGSGWDFGWGEQDDKESIEAIHKALDMGINWIDTAAVYGVGHSEEIVAKAVKEYYGSKPYVFTKCVLLWDENGHVTKSLDPQSIRKECEDSLRRLRVDIIDLYQIHWPPDDNDEEIKPAWEMMAQLKEEGKVRYIGVSNFNVEQIKIAESIAPVTSLQPKYSLISRNIENEILPYVKKQNIGVIVYSPMGSGILTGKYNREKIEKLPEDDWRKGARDFNEPNLTKNLAIVDELKKIAEEHNRHGGEVAVAWTLKHEAVTAAIVGARNAKQAEEIMFAHDLVLTEEDVKRLEEF
ncbi:putative aldo/keto reductase [hydrocarbon metagenome]|uniref:Putative aldo/keto reductase n=1 Tax=hydrocarbon metagenome TaxID=938273 RepID=A0A0W8FZV2_9ZZZZ